MKNFRKVAQDSVSLTPLMSGREKIKTSDLVNQTLTVSAFDIARIKDFVDKKSGEVSDVEYAVFVFEEMPEKYWQSGTVGTRIAYDWLSLYDGESSDIHDQCAELSDELAPEKIKFKITSSTTRSDNPITRIEVI